MTPEKAASGHDEIIIILDFGGQYTQLIARRLREMKVYCEIVPFNKDLSAYNTSKIKGYILSGGPSSVISSDAPRLPKTFFDTTIPILGICYGMQLIAHELGGRLERATMSEYGHSDLSVTKKNKLFEGVAATSRAWMNHGDSIRTLPPGFEITASTESLPNAAMAHTSRPIYGVQFHPEVAHTEEGKNTLRNFAFGICGCHGTWTEVSFIDETITKVRAQVGSAKVILGISGGVDSVVAALLLHKAIGDQLFPIFVDTGLLRENEFESVMTMLEDLHVPTHGVRAGDLFLSRLAGVIDPEKKRKIIGATFIDVFEDEAKRIGQVDFLAQGTLYPDVIESVSVKGPSATIKTHHNVGGLKERMHFKLVEPLRELFKDEVRAVGRTLGAPDKFLKRHPFPGPGLAVRILGEITPERLRIIRQADAIYLDELVRSGEYDNTWQAFAVLLPVQSVGVMGDERTYENVVALRAVTSEDGMTADWARLPYAVLNSAATRIANQVKGVNRVVYDISSKPPATIEWE